eukprot:Nitzschia sp. Nitz4//scaffold124_size66437//46033//46356//NITZ4_006116-RA/size66437-exonerate_est2genome-gene-0.62-mRNA-1//-1//CDS//3329534567//7421//frame0
MNGIPLKNVSLLYFCADCFILEHDRGFWCFRYSSTSARAPIHWKNHRPRPEINDTHLVLFQDMDRAIVFASELFLLKVLYYKLIVDTRDSSQQHKLFYTFGRSNRFL